MGCFYEIKQDSEVYSEVLAMDKMWDKWHDVDIEKEMKEEIGIDIKSADIGMTGDVLMLKNVPENKKDQFKKSRNRYGYWEAKKKSPINITFINFCNKHNLITPDKWRPVLNKGLWIRGGKKTMYTFYNRYFIESEKEFPADTEGFLTKISEIEFLEIQLAYKKKEAAS